MKGDLSRWDIVSEQNLNGVLHQQGRVLLDRDWNEQTNITIDWQDRAGRDIIGTGVAAIPASTPDALKVTEATVNAADQVVLTVEPGSGWADGLAVSLPGDTPVSRQATYLGPPIQDPAFDPSTIGADVRDAVILEVWREALNGFQEPEKYIEPALGGPDTTERIHTTMRFRLFRLGPEDNCRDLTDRLQDDPAQKGKLTASLLPTTATTGDCPVVEGGGYTGFEHFLYRVEIAQVNAPQIMFKWSQFNGGLVGRGECDLGGTDKKISITANDQAIKMSGLTDFYLEVLELDAIQGAWRVTYGADVTLNGDDLEVTTERYAEAARPTGRVFFRLWNEIRRIAEFPQPVTPAEPAQLQDGIRLAFDADSGDNYRPGDYWTFKVRAGDIAHPDPLIDDEAPHGPHYHRVPLAILNWDSDKDISFDADEIEDCRDVFPPLTKQTVCCSYKVGDGKSSFGDFNAIEEALRHLPASGGEVCLLPGSHKANVVIEGKTNIKITGCDKKTQVIPREESRQAPIFHVKDSTCITLAHMDLVTLEGTAIVMEGSKPGKLQEIEIHHNRIVAARNAIWARQGVDINIHHNKIRMLDKEEGDVAIYILADDALIERNNIAVVPAGTTPPPEGVPDGDQTPEDPADPCAVPEKVYQNPIYLAIYIAHIWNIIDIITAFFPTNPFKALGGIQVGSGSEQIKILDNQIIGGAGNGITLGSDLKDVVVDPPESDPTETPTVIINRQRFLWGEVIFEGKPIGDISLIIEGSGGQTFSVISNKDDGRFFVSDTSGLFFEVFIATPGYKIDGFEIEDHGELLYRFFISKIETQVDWSGLLDFIYEVLIDRNEITNMGLSGIGVPQVDPEELALLAEQQNSQFLLILVRLFGILNGLVVNLNIHHNHIFNCLQNATLPEPIPSGIQRGLGGMSLGLCENLIIHLNRIEDNGRNHLTPACGIFVSYADGIDISHNQIMNNGPLDLAANDSAGFRQGVRGGIVLGMATSHSIIDLLAGAGGEAGTVRGLSVIRARGNVEAVDAAATQPAGSLAAAASARDTNVKGRHAARIHDNIVEQPVGRALTILALGPVSVVNNQLSSDFAEPRPRSAPGVSEGLGGVAGVLWGLVTSPGAVLIVNAGRPAFLQPQSLTSRRLAESISSLPNGITLFNSNQVSLGSDTGTSVSSVMIASADDIGFEGNQSDVLQAQALSLNTILFSMTLRAGDSRFREPSAVRQTLGVSLFSFSQQMNTTTFNQGNHCIIAICSDHSRERDAGNLVLSPTTNLCGTLKEIIRVFLKPKVAAATFSYGVVR